MEKKYQVFISSTYEDLKDERQKAIDSVLRLEHIPIGMELFNAGDDTQWAIIQRAIDNTDYYILIVGFRYGSVTEDDISYTEKEYDYAISKKIPVIAFIKDRNSPVRADERESSQRLQKKLESFIAKVQKKEVNCWKNPDELAAKITSSLVNQIKLVPRTGWIRADADPVAMGQEIATLSEENRELHKLIDNISKKRPKLDITVLDPDEPEEEVALTHKYQHPEGNVYVRKLTKSGLPDEVKELVTEQDLEIYNDALPAKEEIEDYNSRNTLYENSQKNAHCFRLGITNNGNSKANNVSVDLTFPKELLVYYDYDIEDIEKPKELKMPEDPVEKAVNRNFTSKIPGVIKTLEMFSQWGTVMPPPVGISAHLHLGRDYDRDYSINESHNTSCIDVDSIVHRRKYVSDKIWFIATKRGVFQIDCEIMCEEYEEPAKYSFDINIE